MMADAVLPAGRARPDGARILTGAGSGRPCRRWPISFVFMVLPMATLLLFGFVTIERGRIVGDSFTLEHLARALQDDAGLAADVAQLLGRRGLDRADPDPRLSGRLRVRRGARHLAHAHPGGDRSRRC